MVALHEEEAEEWNGRGLLPYLTLPYLTLPYGAASAKQAKGSPAGASAEDEKQALKSSLEMDRHAVCGSTESSPVH